VEPDELNSEVLAMRAGLEMAERWMGTLCGSGSLRQALPTAGRGDRGHRGWCGLWLQV
jgi:hypothetical protein